MCSAHCAETTDLARETTDLREPNISYSLKLPTSGENTRPCSQSTAKRRKPAAASKVGSFEAPAEVGSFVSFHCRQGLQVEHFLGQLSRSSSVTGDWTQSTAAPPPLLAPTMTPTTVSTMTPTCSHAAQPVPPPIPCHTTPLKRGLHLPSRGAGSFSRRQDEPVHAAARLPCARRREPTMHTASVHRPRWPRGSA